MPRPPCVHATSPTLRKLVAGYAAFPQMAGRDCRMPLLMFSLALRTTKTTPGLIATGDYPPSLCSPWRAAMVIKNCIPDIFLKIEHPDSYVIGYGAGLECHTNDLSVLGSSIAQLMTDGCPFLTFADADEISKLLSLPDKPTSLGSVALKDWPIYLTQMGIGVAPLDDTKFNEAKSWLKMLEMAAVGVPCVVSPRAEYKALFNEDIGLLAEKPREWYKTLKRLAQDPVERTELSEKGREVASRYTFTLRASQWAEAWTRAYELARKEG